MLVPKKKFFWGGGRGPLALGLMFIRGGQRSSSVASGFGILLLGGGGCRVHRWLLRLGKGPGHPAAGRFHLAARLGIWQLAPSWQLGSIWQLSIWVVGWGGVVSGFFRSLVEIFPKIFIASPLFSKFLVVFLCRRPKIVCQKISRGDHLPLTHHLEK